MPLNFLTGDGVPYKLIERRTDRGTPSYSCDSLSQQFRKLHRQAGIEGTSEMSGHRTFLCAWRTTAMSFATSMSC
jgi:hypothetical protein